jgi:collagenase-like PrtC family protease
MKLTLGPLFTNWPAEKWTDFYAAIAEEAPVDRVVIGEVVCSKRLPFYADRIADAVDRLVRAGKEVVLASLALVTSERERQMCADLAAMDSVVEINDVTMLRHLSPGRAFTVGPLVNVYNEGTLAFLVRSGARSVCLPPEIPIACIGTLAAEARARGIEIECWAFGRTPLAISGRCYHARIHRLSKDSCQYVCGKDADGLKVETMDGDAFLVVNGVQTLSFVCANAIGEVETLQRTGVTHLRLSPHDCDMVGVARIFRARIDGSIGAKEALVRLAAIMPDMPFSNGFMMGRTGAERLTTTTPCR